MMISWTVPKAMAAGISVLIFAQIMYVGVMVSDNQYELLRLILLIFPCVSAFVATYFAPRWKLAVGFSMAIFGASIGMLSAYVYEHFGLHVDQIGGHLVTFLVLLVYDAVLSIIGSVAGYTLSGKKQGQV